MKVKKLIAFALAFVMLFSMSVPALASDEKLAAEETWNNGSPYYIMVNRKTCTLTVFGLDEDEIYYSVPVKVMLCSTGKPGEETPLGTFWINDQRGSWWGMVDDSYAQYASAFYGNYMIHSVCYHSMNKDDLMYEEYNDIGTNVSLGCVRLQVGDAKWIFDNCPVGTTVTVYESDDPGPLGKPSKKVPYITEETNNGWDPTDPDERNPWNNYEPVIDDPVVVIPPESIELDSYEVTVESGKTVEISASVYPEDADFSDVKWSTTNPAVATVKNGKITGISTGLAIIMVSCGDVSAYCYVSVIGELMPFTDCIPGSWYYSDVRKAVTLGMFSGTSETTFAPDVTMTRAMMVQVLHNIAGGEIPDIECPFDDVSEGAWYYDSLLWAYKNGIVSGISAHEFDPDGVVTREQFSAMLYRYFTVYQRNAAYLGDDDVLEGYDDRDNVSAFAVDAVRWMVANGITHGVSDTELGMKQGTSRAQAAAILARWHEIFFEGYEAFTN